jgi:hypothetical protein
LAAQSGWGRCGWFPRVAKPLAVFLARRDLILGIERRMFDSEIEHECVLLLMRLWIATVFAAAVSQHRRLRSLS